MTYSLSPYPISLALQGDRAQRPPRDEHQAAELRSQLNHLIARTAHTSASPLVVRSSSLRSGAVSFEANPLGRARGVLVTTALRLLVNGVHLSDSFADVLDAWRRAQGASEVTQGVDQLDADDHARLAADVRAHVSVLRDHLGTIPSNWRPRTAVRTRLFLGAGALELRDDVDLVVGSSFEDVAAIALLDVTTSPLGIEAERVLRYHALVQTLRSGVVPLRTCLFSTATGELWSREVDPDLLQRAVSDVAALWSVAVAA
jgi:hypothetical protein